MASNYPFYQALIYTFFSSLHHSLDKKSERKLENPLNHTFFIDLYPSFFARKCDRSFQNAFYLQKA